MGRGDGGSMGAGTGFLWGEEPVLELEGAVAGQCERLSATGGSAVTLGPASPLHPRTSARTGRLVAPSLPTSAGGAGSSGAAATEGPPRGAAMGGGLFGFTVARGWPVTAVLPQVPEAHAGPARAERLHRRLLPLRAQQPEQAVAALAAGRLPGVRQEVRAGSGGRGARAGVAGRLPSELGLCPAWSAGRVARVFTGPAVRSPARGPSGLRHDPSAARRREGSHVCEQTAELCSRKSRPGLAG